MKPKGCKPDQSKNRNYSNALPPMISAEGPAVVFAVAVAFLVVIPEGNLLLPGVVSGKARF